MQKAKGNHHKMSKTPEGRPSSADVKNNSEELSSALREMGRAAVEAVKRALETMIGRDFGKQAKNTSDTIAPEYPVYPEPSFPEFVTTPDGHRSPVESGNTPAVLIEPPEPTPDDIARNKRKDEERDAAAKHSTIDRTNPEGLTPYEQFMRDRYLGDEYDEAEYGDDEPKKDDNPEGLTPYEQAMRDKYFGDEYDEAEYGDDEPKKDDNPEGLTPYEQFMRDRYLGDEYDEAEYGDDEQSGNKADAEKTEMSAEEHEAAANLKIARERFAKASIAVETHFFKKHFGGKKRQEELNAATEELKKSELEYMRIKFADEIEAVRQDADKQAGLAAEIAQAAFANMQETSKRTSERYDEMLDGRNKFKKYAAKVGEWFTKGGKVSQWLKLGGAGFAVGTTTAAFAGWPITTATLVATKLAVAGALKQNILEERRGEDRIAKNRPDYLDSSFAKDMAGKEADYVMNRAVDMSVDKLKDVSVKRQEDLYRRIGSGLVKYTIGFGLGGLAGNWLSSTYATGNSVPQSGSEAVDANSTGDSVPQSGSGAVDTGVSTPEAPNVPEINFDSYDYPWDWAAEKFGDANAMDQLHNLADKAMANGHAVRWYNTGGIEYLEVDGSSATAHVLDVLSRYV